MVVVDDLTNSVAFHLSLDKVVQVIQNIRHKKETEIEQIKDKISKYEKKRRAEEAWYQSLSSVRKFFAGRPPSHHQAVEYLVHVKERFYNIEQLRNRIAELDGIIHLLQTERSKEQIVLPHIIIEEIKEWQETGGRNS
jgi:acetyl-CoA carboxylase alpha subunit